MKKLSEQYTEKYVYMGFAYSAPILDASRIEDLLHIKYHETMKNYGQKSLDKWIENRHSKFLIELAKKHGLIYETNN